MMLKLLAEPRSPATEYDEHINFLNLLESKYHTQQSSSTD
jgi:hypothetical protein